MFNVFMQNPYWKNIYDNSSDLLKKYYHFKFSNHGKEYTNDMINELKKIRDKFSKQDWKQLIAQSTGRAKYEYTRMMNEKFPETK